MKYRLAIHRKVEVDLDEAERWYEGQRVGLGREFIQSIYLSIEKLRQNPLLYRVRNRRRGIRWALSRQFPYRVVFAVNEDAIVVYAVMHTARHERRWRRRL